MFDNTFFKMGFQFLLVIVVGLLLAFSFSGYVTDQSALPAQTTGE